MFIRKLRDGSIGVLLSCPIDNLIEYNYFEFFKILPISIRVTLELPE